MSRSFAVFAGVAAVGLVLISGIETRGSAQSTLSTKNPGTTARNANAKMGVATPRKQPPHRLVIHVDVNDPAVIRISLSTTSATSFSTTATSVKRSRSKSSLTGQDCTCCETIPRL